VSITLIKKYALTKATNRDWKSVADILNKLTETIIDETHWTFGLMMTQGKLPEMLVVGVAKAVDDAGTVNPLMKSAFTAFSTTGIQLHTPERQALIDAIGVGLPAEAVALVKSLGIRTVPILSNPITEDECKNLWYEDNRSSSLAQTFASVQQYVSENSDVTLKSVITKFDEELSKYWEA
jgi:hypothetical protein